MTELVREKILDELNDLNGWFAEIKATLELSQKADRGRVLAALNKLKEELDERKSEQALIASYHGYSAWGYFFNSVVKAE